MPPASSAALKAPLTSTRLKARSASSAGISSENV
jgi:hypothetical protein